MKKINKKIIISLALIFIIIFLLSNSIFATDPGKWEPTDTGDNSKFMERAGIILGWIQYIGILVSIIALTVIGIKYLFSSVEGKAEYKKTMMPYILGCFLLAGTSLVVGMVANISADDEISGPTVVFIRNSQGTIFYYKCLECNESFVDPENDISREANCPKCNVEWEIYIRKPFKYMNYSGWYCSWCGILLTDQEMNMKWCNTCSRPLDTTTTISGVP